MYSINYIKYFKKFQGGESVKVKDFIKQEEDNKTPLAKRLQLVRKIFYICMEINNYTQYYAFFSLSPHVNWASVQLTPKSDFNNYILNIVIDYEKLEEKEIEEVAVKLMKYLRESDTND